MRRSAAEKRWKSEEEKKKQCKPDKCDEEVPSLLPDGLAVKLDILSMVAPSFPDCPILSSKPCLANRSGKSTIYKQLKAVKACLISCPLANQVILSWACKLAITDYAEFKEQGLSFRQERDIPIEIVIKERTEAIKNEVWVNTKGEDVRRLLLDQGL